MNHSKANQSSLVTALKHIHMHTIRGSKQNQSWYKPAVVECKKEEKKIKQEPYKNPYAKFRSKPPIYSSAVTFVLASRVCFGLIFLNRNMEGEGSVLIRRRE